MTSLRTAAVAALTTFGLGATLAAGPASAAGWTRFTTDIDQRGPVLMTGNGTIAVTSYLEPRFVVSRLGSGGKTLVPTGLIDINDDTPGKNTPVAATGKDQLVGLNSWGYARSATSDPRKRGYTFYLQTTPLSDPWVKVAGDTVAGRYRESLMDITGNARGDVAVLLGTDTKRSVWLRRAGTRGFHLALRVPGGKLCLWQCPSADTAIALGARGDLFVAWEDRNNTVRARYLNPAREWQPVQVVGRGTRVEGSIQATLSSTGRRYLLVRPSAGAEQLLTGTDSTRLTPVTRGLRVSHALRPRSGWEQGSVRLVGGERDTSMLAWREARGSSQAIVVADLNDGKLKNVKMLAARGVRDLSGAAIARNGAAVVAWETDDQHGHKQMAAVRRRSGAAFRTPTTLDTGALRWNQSVLISPTGKRAYVSFLDGSWNLMSTPVG